MHCCFVINETVFLDDRHLLFVRSVLKYKGSLKCRHSFELSHIPQVPQCYKRLLETLTNGVVLTINLFCLL